MNTSIDLNIDHYSTNDLLELFHLSTDFTEDQLNDAFIHLLKKKSILGNTNYLRFLKQAMTKLQTDVLQPDSSSLSDEKELSDTTQSPGKTTKQDDYNQTTSYEKSYLDSVYKSDNITNRKYGAIATDDDKHNVMLKQRLPIEEGYSLPIVRGQINPNLHNINTSIINIDSQFRENLSEPANNFTFNLSEPLQKVVEFRMLSMEIPQSWYVFDTAYGTDFFYIDGSLVQIPSGNYNIGELVSTINDTVQTMGFDLSFNYNTNQNTITIDNMDILDHSIIFYDSNNERNSKENNNLGWILGFRSLQTNSLNRTIMEYTITSGNHIRGESLVDIYGPRYILLEIDDYNYNKVNKGIINVTEDRSFLSMPSYYTPDISLSNPIYLNSVDIYGNPKPSGLTQAQAHTIMEINESQQKNTVKRYSGSKDSDIFARIPIKKSGEFDMYIFFNNILQSFKREFLGPVDIKRMTVRLYNDKGQLLDLHSQDFSISLLVEELYQY
jgi:hypothetical protein